MEHQRQQPQQQPPPSRPLERGLIHNPNHQPPSQKPSSFPSFPPPPVSQAPVHIPFSADPFSRRDPFINSSQPDRRGSLGYQNRDSGPGSSGERGGWTNNAGPVASGHHPRPSSPSAGTGPDYMSHPFDSARRRSLGAGTPSHQYGAPLDPPPPPPPSLGVRAMLPPSPSQQPNVSNNFSNPLSRGPPPPPNLGTARDLAALNAAHRPGSSMSISSMLGSDSTAPHHVSSSASNAVASVPFGPSRPMQPPSPRRRASSTLGQYGHNGSSEKQYSSNGSRSEGTPSAGASSPGRAFSAKPSSPEFMRSHHPSVSQTSAASGFRSFQPPGSEVLDRSENQLPPTSIPPRPSSQPTGPRESAFSPTRPSNHDSSGARVFHDVTYESRNQRLQEGQSRHVGVHDFRQSPSNPISSRARANTMQPTTQSAFSPPRERVPIPYQPRDFNHPRPQQSDWSPPSLESRDRASRENTSDIFRPSFHSQSLNSRLSSAESRSLSDDIKQYRAPDKFSDRLDSSLFGSARSPERIANPNSQILNPINAPDSQGRMPQFDQRIALPEDHPQQQRSLLGVSPEFNRTRARGSPLPQAVQGAQPHRSGPGDGPGVKHEFGRMFSGLGSGVGSNTPIAGMTANGTSTPGRQTPTRAFDELERVNSGLEVDPEGVKLVREVSRGGRRGRRIKDEDKVGSDSGESRATPSLSGRRGSKRAKTSHPTHHFHVTAHGHHHHHAQHAEDENPFTSLTSSMPQSATPFNPLKFNSSYQSQPAFPSPSQPHHHRGHHHHHAPPHHHHHPPKAPNPGPHLQRKPQTRVVSLPILNSVSHLPRQHLGSALYNPRVSIPASTTPSAIDVKHGFTSRARPLPQFDGKANCTFTIRVPRYFLKPAQREAVCGSRCLWGADVYTDDSDPLAACIHGGWIRGEWGDDKTVNLLFDSGHDNVEVSPDILKDPPKSGPMLPPEARDLHITVLILPPLESYASTTSFGLKSRSWGENHDGMSYKVLKLEWVDEGTGRAQERTGAARRKRLAGRMKLMKDMMGDLKVVEGLA